MSSLVFCFLRRYVRTRCCLVSIVCSILGIIGGCTWALYPHRHLILLCKNRPLQRNSVSVYNTNEREKLVNMIVFRYTLVTLVTDPNQKYY